ncbi:MAG: saccharopine dehydrogenase family protein [Anaerolineae bacterium]
MGKTFLILGGYGTTGSLIARYLLEETDVQLILAGRNAEIAETLADVLNGQYGSDRVSAMRVDAADPQDLRMAFDRAGLVVVASSTAEYVETVARAALEARIDYVDLQYSTAKIEALKSMQAQIEEAGCCFITDGGFHPGLPAALVRYAATHFERLEKATVASVIKVDWSSLSLSPATVEEMVREFQEFQMVYYQDGRWIKTGWTDMKRFDFGLEFGEQPCAAMLLEEMRALPEMIPSLQETGFFVGGFNWFVDYLVLPVSLAVLRIWPQKAVKPAGKLILWGLNRFSKPPYRTILLLEASGWKAGEHTTMHVRVHHEDGYVMTAAPVVACLLQYLDGSIKGPGLWLQANVVEPCRLLEDMERLGVMIETQAQGTSRDKTW